MKLRPPAIPLITIDPFFSVWSFTDKLYDSDTVHWTGSPQKLSGIVTIDGEEFRFMGTGSEPVIKQLSFDYNALSTYYTFGNDKITLSLVFTSPLLPDDLDIMSRPVSFLRISAKSADKKKHSVKVKISASEALCLGHTGQSPVLIENVEIDDMECILMGNSDQNVLNHSADDHRIDWGYFYLAVCGESAQAYSEHDEETNICISADLRDDVLVLFAYDDIKSISYFGEHINSYWNKDGKTITDAMSEALYSYEETFLSCEAFSEGLFIDGVRAGGKKYAEMLELAYRQSVAAHKIAVDTDGELLFISKECFSGGCAATVDVSYPSIPLYLIYNPELIHGMLRPIYKFESSDRWNYDFAPHDVGMYPIVCNQMYGENEDGSYDYNKQMPIEECGNMLIMEAASALALGNADFAQSHIEILEKWVKYLMKYGYDPENQLCTDDFAGHLANNCNLSLKAIMGIVSFSIILRMIGKKHDAAEYMSEAKKMAASWCKRASNGDGSYRLAFDLEDSFSMKYNAVWDKIFGTGIFPPEVISSELFSNFKHFGAYGMPLDNRADYTKSDWIVWTATMLEDDDDFERFITPMWQGYHKSASRVPMTDWYDTKTAALSGFRNRTVVGGLFMKTLSYLGKLDINNI